MVFEVSIILCTVNEIENLPVIVRKIEENAKFNYQLVFVDDGSTDGTRKYIQDYAQGHQNVKYFFYPNKRSTLIAEYYGIKNSDGKFIIIMDSDQQHPPEKINEIYDNLSAGYDIVVASRYVEGGGTAKRNPMRGLISRTAEFLAKVLLKNARKSTDPLSGFFGLRGNLELELDERWRGYKLLLFILSSNPHAKVKDIPYKFRERSSGESKIVNGFDFVRLYLTEIFLAKRVEISYRMME